MTEVMIYVDGACMPNPGRGGWAAIFITHVGDRLMVREVSGDSPDYTTNQRMEVTAAIHALQHLNFPCKVTLASDSQYLIKGATCWKGYWNSKQMRGVANTDLWEQLYAAAAQHHVAWQWVRGHSGDIYNERCDRLARNAVRGVYVDKRQLWLPT